MEFEIQTWIFPPDKRLVEKNCSEFCQSEKYHWEKNYKTLQMWGPQKVCFK